MKLSTSKLLNVINDTQGQLSPHWHVNNTKVCTLMMLYDWTSDTKFKKNVWIWEFSSIKEWIFITLVDQLKIADGSQCHIFVSCITIFKGNKCANSNSGNFKISQRIYVPIQNQNISLYASFASNFIRINTLFLVTNILETVNLIPIILYTRKLCDNNDPDWTVC